ncbi:MAG TPA: DUF6510 family protein [Jatrophihabitantaceae bacterium]|jgi:hypothetical protein
MMTHLDGNAAAGDLRTIFAVDVTAATGQCAACGRTAPLGTAQLYNQAPGLVVRCTGCDSVLLRLVNAPGRAWLDVRGLRYLQLETG